MKGSGRGIIKYAMTSALYRVHAIDVSIGVDMQRKTLLPVK
jgi:hypothetical protein